jgi:uncharacterized protein YqjF (DUF2071 family)
MPRLFLTARWSDLVLVSYAVPDALLAPRLPPGLVLDRWNGSAFVSLVAFDFRDTRVRGVRWPGHTNFAEINLRFYVRQGERRGVVFVREIVPQPLTALAARVLYNEPYRTAPIASHASRSDGRFTKEYRLRWRGREQRIAVAAAGSPMRPTDASAEHWFKEHEWGFGRSRSGRTTVYRVEHPVWDVHPVESHALAFDFGQVYGPEWAPLNGREPDSVVLAAGSAIKVFGLDASELA